MKRFSFLKNLVIAIATALALGGCSLYELVNGNRSSLTTDVSFDTSYDDTSDGVIPKKIMDFFNNQKIFLEKTAILLFFVRIFVIFSHISSQKSFSQKNIPCHIELNQ